MRCKRCRLVLRTTFAKCEPPRSNPRSLAYKRACSLVSLDYPHTHRDLHTRSSFLHRRIVVAYRLRRLGSANSLLWAVSLRQKQHSVVFNLLHVVLEDLFLFLGEGLFEDLLLFAALVVVTVPLCIRCNYICSLGNIPSECVCRAIYPRSSFISFEFVLLSSCGMILPCHSSFIMLSIGCTSC